MRGLSTATETNFAGILYAEDFDDPGDLDDAGLSGRQIEPAPPPITQADVEAACAAAVRAARLDWQVAQEQSRIQAVAALSTVLGGIRETAERATLAAAEGTVSTILAMVCGVLPHFAREHGPAEIRVLLARLLPTIRSRERINVRVHPDLVIAIQRDLGELEPGLADMIDVSAAPIEPGDVKVNWENGALVRDTRKIAQAVQDALSQLGLHQAIEAPAKRSMAYAD